MNFINILVCLAQIIDKDAINILTSVVIFFVYICEHIFELIDNVSTLWIKKSVSIKFSL